MSADTDPKAYSKKVNDQLSISLKYLESDASFVRTCQLTVQNTGDKDAIINPQPTSNETNKSWLPSFFTADTDNESSRMLENHGSGKMELYLGRVQLFGFVVLNYKFNHDTAALEMQRHPQWWRNANYISEYSRRNEKEEDGLQPWSIETTPFIAERLNNRLKVGGKLGGVSDLSVELSETSTTNNGHLLYDLVGNFDSFPSSNRDLPLKDFVDSIVPIYATPQSLLFTDLVLESGKSKTFTFQIPINENLPPSYNTGSTGIACDQGWTSVRYSVEVSMHQGDMVSKPKSVYFPLTIEPRKVANKSLQRVLFGDELGLDKDWSILLDMEEPCKDLKSNGSAKKDFLLDLSSLLGSDLYNMPKMSTTERRKSSVNSTFIDPQDEKYVTQLPSHLKTSFQLRVNDEDLCKVTISKPYYYVGDDVNFTAELNLKGSTRIVGMNAYIEACEVYHTKRELENVYKVTGNVKLNLLASALGKSSCLVNDYLNIPKFVAPQFKSKTFMDLKYYLTFQFNFATISEYLDNEQEGEGKEKGKEFVPIEILRGDLTANSYPFRVPLYILA
ncbi:uncharacterized protein LODBEIA_P46530 [Lodderomyces beijingensis]|uniref:Arrestin-like N-terminal domain-containing protein n=1 Tax=Lodderomyces beijingensis TaxID=1775926 RepID=A0ABP0ZR94_9ASCO